MLTRASMKPKTLLRLLFVASMVLLIFVAGLLLLPKWRQTELMRQSEPIREALKAYQKHGSISTHSEKHHQRPATLRSSVFLGGVIQGNRARQPVLCIANNAVATPTSTSPDGQGPGMVKTNFAEVEILPAPNSRKQGQKRRLISESG